jgi:hypothetical protein
MEYTAYKICSGWATSEGSGAFSTNAMRRDDTFV